MSCLGYAGAGSSRGIGLGHGTERTHRTAHYARGILMVTRAVAEDETQPTTGTPLPEPLKNHRVAVLSASKSAVYPVVELEKPIGTYMTLPASQYSVLDAQRIERIDETSFRCYVGGINFLNFRVEPVLTLSVIVGERGPTVRLLETTLEGSKAALEANSKFTATMTNEVAWWDGREHANIDVDGLCIASDTTLTVTLQVPRWFVVPVSVVESSGSKIMQKILDVSVPKFLSQLNTDYAKWSAGEVRETMDEDL